MRDSGFTVFCALGIMLCLVPLPWHWRARNSGTLLYLGWTLVGCLVFFVNSIIWAGNMNDSAPIWCDISTRLVVGLSAGVTASSLCINRQLYHIATVREVTMFHYSKKRDLIVNMVLGLGLPVLVMVLYYIVEESRYIIIEDIGCWPSVSTTLLTVPMVLIWPIMISVASFIYAGLTIRAFIQTRRQFSQVLLDSDSGLNMSRYFRLMALAATEMLFSLPLGLYFLFSDVLSSGVLPWISWEHTHTKFSKIYTTPHQVLEALPNVKSHLDLNRWVTPAGAFVFFLYFGLSGEARKEYRRIFWKVSAIIGIKPRILDSTRSQAPNSANGKPRAERAAFTGTLASINVAHSIEDNMTKGDGIDGLPKEPERMAHDLEAHH